jgi:hypothetical protein
VPFKNSDGDLTFDVGLAGSSFSYSFAEQSNFSHPMAPKPRSWVIRRSPREFTSVTPHRQTDGLNR